jgi:hypothetical protein
MHAGSPIHIKQISLLFFILLHLSAAAQTLYLYPTAVTAPRGSDQTVTAVVQGVSDKTVTWSTDGGTIVGTNPCVVNEPCTAALYTTTAGTYHLTATSNANGSVAATSTITFTASPTPTTSHPRLLVTAAMLPALQAKTTPGNTIYQALRTQAIAAYSADNTVWSWSCNAGTGLPSANEANNWEQQNAYLYAFMSMIDPSDPTYKWGCYGRDVWTYVMKEVMNGSTDLLENEWSDSSPHFAFTTDFLMAGGYLSSTDQAQARTFLAYMSQLVLNNSVGDSWNTTTSTYSSSAQFNSGGVWDLTGMRAMGNNYTESKLLYLVAAGLTFDDNATDDPALPNTCGATRYEVCPDFSAGSLHAYWRYFVGTALYLQWAHLEDPNVSWQAYQAFYGNLPTQPTCFNTDLKYHPCFGDGRGGEASEGSWYDYSLYRLRYAMNAVHTAGYDDPMLYGPQISMENSSWWDMKYITDLEFLTGFGPYNGESGTAGGTPAYNFLTTGDSNTYYRVPSDMWPESAILVTDSYTGRTDRTNALEWPILNTAFGGPLGNQGGCNEYCGFTSEIANPLGQSVDEDLFIALPAGDPTTALPSDPRPSLPTDLYNGSFNQHIMVRSSWASTGTLFSYYCPNTLIDHEHQFCGRFDIFANNEYITKGRTEFTDYNDTMSTAPQQGIAAILNTTGSDCTAADGCAFWPSFTYGGQMWHSYQAGLVTLQHEELPTYVAAIVDNTNDYNGSANQYGDYNDVTGASRSLVYLRGTNQVVFYDRAATGHAASKVLYQNTTGALSISDNTASWATRSGKQSVYFTSLLPSGATIADVGLTSSTYWEQADDWEPYTTLEVSSGSPLSTQFLSVMQWGGSTFTPGVTSLVQSTSGDNFDGGVLGSSVVMFMRAWPATLTGVTYPASGGTTQYVSDLTPNAAYSIVGDGTPSTAVADAAGVLVFPATGTGSISIGPGTVTVTGITVTPSFFSLVVGASQQYRTICTYSDGASADCTSTVTWTSSASGIATINILGLVVGVLPGSANLTGTSGTISGSATVTVDLTGTAIPTFSPAAGTYTSTQTVTISSATPGATIYYTTNGTIPTTGSTVFANPITVSSSETIEAIAVASGDGTSPIGSATYTISLPQAATPTFSPGTGTYTSAQTVIISSTIPSATIYYTTNGTTPTTSSTLYSGPISISSSETVEAIAVASGYTPSAAGSAIYTISLAQAATPKFSPGAGNYNSTQMVTITSATPEATIYYTTNGTTPTTSSTVYSAPLIVSSSETIEAIAAISGLSTSATGVAAYTINLTQVATPTFSPASGTYASAQTVTISSSTPGATIYYTVNGSRPTINSATYTGPITVSASEQIRAFATATGFMNSVIGSATYTIAPPAAAPTFSPAAGSYTTAQTVRIFTTTPSATIYYTTDGTTPTTSSALYSSAIKISSSETLEAIVVARNYSSSAAGSAAYTINLGQAATPTFSPGAGTYASTQTVNISSATLSATIYYTTNGTTPTTSSTLYAGPVTVSSSETLEAIATANGYSTSAAGSAAYTVNITQTATPTFSPAGGTYTSGQQVLIGSATPSATIYYTTNGSTPTTGSTIYTGPINVSSSETLEAIATTSGLSTSSIGSANYNITPPAATPTFSPVAGAYTSPQSVSIKSASPSATIYYTSNGSTPTTRSAIYSGPITVSSSETVEAIATASGYSASAVGSAVYTINLTPAATPTFSPGTGTYASIQTVSINSATPLATIYYTTDGTTPTTSSTLYSGPITVSNSETLGAIATANNYSTSAVAAAAFTIAPPASTPTFTPGAGTYTSAQTVTIASPTPSAIIYYTSDGTTPTTASNLYIGPITVASSETLTAFAVATGYSPSGVNSAAYTINLPTPSFIVAVTPGSLAVTTGQSGTATVSVMPLNSFDSPVQFSCSGLPAGASCIFSPANVMPSGTAASSTLTITTSETHATLQPNSVPLFPGSVLAVALCWFGWKKRRGLQVLVALAAVGASLVIGCGGSIKISSQGQTQPTTSIVTVTAASGTLQQTTTFSLTVQ